MGPNTVEIWTTAPLAYLLINGKAIELEEVPLSNMQNPRTFREHFVAGHKFSLLNRDKLTQPIQMQLSKKKKAFSIFFSAFLKGSENFEDFQKKMTFIADVFPNLWITKNVVK